ncbi:MAG: hypothetical protein IT269_08955, partial [Saprospiraceae bacterium]|nr:hypothetical protein [Saprospiraceae bacterium]
MLEKKHFWLLLPPVCWLMISQLARQQEFLFALTTALSGVPALLIFERCLRLLAAGTRWQSRFVFTGLLVGLAPSFSGWMNRGPLDGLTLTGWLAALWAILWIWEHGRLRRLSPRFLIVLAAVILMMLAGWAFVEANAHWSPVNWFSRGIACARGEGVYYLPNLPGIVLTLVHPMYFSPLLLLSPLMRRTDFMRIEQQWLTIMLLLTALMISGAR